MKVPPAPGHVFIANNSACNIYCDAFLAPVAMSSSERSPSWPSGTVFSQWRFSLKDRDMPLYQHLFEKKERGMQAMNVSGKVATFKEWPWEDFQKHRDKAIPLPFVGQVGYMLMGKEAHVSTLVDTAQHFIDNALALLRTKQPGGSLTGRPGCKHSK